jgi:hypothetical protein
MYRYVIILFFTISFQSFSQHTTGYSAGSVSDFKETPAIKWIFKTGSPLFSSPVVNEKTVYIGMHLIRKKAIATGINPSQKDGH